MLGTIAGLTLLAADALAREPRRAAPITEATAPRQAGEPIMAIVSIKTQQITFYDADGWILRAPVSTGKTEHETPAGIFAVVEKKKDHRSNLYDDAWMPHMQRITWNGIALHGGPLPGHAASKGCVRLPYGFAEKLFDRTRMGMRVIISPNDAAPEEVSHAALLVPNAEALTAAPARAESLAREAAEAAQAADAAKRAAATAARETAMLKASLRKLELSRNRANAELALADRALAAANTDQARARADDLRQKAAPRAAELGSQFDAASADAAAKLAAAAAAKDVVKAAETRKVGAAKAASEAKLALEPVSIYISRATQKLYVRRATGKPLPDGGEVFDATIEVPVKIRNPERRIGTHVFTAMARNNSGLRWSAVTIDDGDDAKSALNRVTIPGYARPNRADGIAAILDHCLGRAAEQRDQLSHRVRRSAEQPFSGRLRHAPSLGRRPHWRRHLLGQRSILFIPRHGPARRYQASARRPVRPSDAAAFLAFLAVVKLDVAYWHISDMARRLTFAELR